MVLYVPKYGIIASIRGAKYYAGMTSRIDACKAHHPRPGNSHKPLEGTEFAKQDGNAPSWRRCCKATIKRISGLGDVSAATLVQRRVASSCRQPKDCKPTHKACMARLISVCVYSSGDKHEFGKNRDITSYAIGAFNGTAINGTKWNFSRSSDKNHHFLSARWGLRRSRQSTRQTSFGGLGATRHC